MVFKMYRITLGILCFLFLPATSFCQLKNIGKIISYKKITGGVEGKTAAGIFDIHAYNDNTIRVRVSKNKTLNNFSYALVNNAIPLFNTAVIDKGENN
ncbi:MAG: hypothetical protein IPP72_05805 [Chitinophagaceae bacterium]|nr:hypothetical protein [Chitinophagaceae bacterium]